MIFSFIEMYKTEHPIELMCRVLRVSRSGYYACRVRPPSHRDRDKAALSERIRHIIGVPEAPMEHRGDPRSVACRWHEGRKQAGSARLMREEGLEGRHQRKKRAHRTTCRHPQAVLPAPDLVERKFTPEARERLCLADISYVPTSWEGFDYLAADKGVLPGRCKPLESTELPDVQGRSRLAQRDSKSGEGDLVWVRVPLQHRSNFCKDGVSL